MVWYHQALYACLNGDEEEAVRALENAAAADSLYCFPNKPEDIAVLQYAIQYNGKDAKAPYYLGCLWYDRRQYDDAIACWEKSVSIDDCFPTAWRNLSLAYFNKRNDPENALPSIPLRLPGHTGWTKRMPASCWSCINYTGS